MRDAGFLPPGGASSSSARARAPAAPAHGRGRGRAGGPRQSSCRLPFLLTGNSAAGPGGGEPPSGLTHDTYNPSTPRPQTPGSSTCQSLPSAGASATSSPWPSPRLRAAPRSPPPPAPQAPQPPAPSPLSASPPATTRASPRSPSRASRRQRPASRCPCRRGPLRRHRLLEQRRRPVHLQERRASPQCARAARAGATVRPPPPAGPPRATSSWMRLRSTHTATSHSPVSA